MTKPVVQDLRTPFDRGTNMIKVLLLEDEAERLATALSVCGAPENRGYRTLVGMCWARYQEVKTELLWRADR